MTPKVKKELNKLLNKYKGDIFDNNGLDWHFISCKKISENFIREFKEKVDWMNISMYQSLSHSFIKEFKDKLWIKTMMRQKRISRKFYNELKETIVVTRFQLLDFNP